MYLWKEEAWCLYSGVRLTKIPREYGFSLYGGYGVNVPRFKALIPIL